MRLGTTAQRISKLITTEPKREMLFFINTTLTLLFSVRKVVISKLTTSDHAVLETIPVPSVWKNIPFTKEGVSTEASLGNTLANTVSSRVAHTDYLGHDKTTQHQLSQQTQILYHQWPCPQLLFLTTIQPDEIQSIFLQKGNQLYLLRLLDEASIDA